MLSTPSPARSNPLRHLAVAGLVALLVLPALPVFAGELAGVRMTDSIEVGDDTLVLNGLGLRKKAIFKVYVGGLYLTSKQTDGKKILASDTPRKMVLEFVRSVGADSLTGAWNDCLEANTPNASAAVKKDFASLNSWMADVEDGDQLAFTYRPGSGTEVMVKGQKKGTLASKESTDALFACWIGDHPPSDDFKAELLGG